jgi:hypothetical protein
LSIFTSLGHWLDQLAMVSIGRGRQQAEECDANIADGFPAMAGSDRWRDDSMPSFEIR